jgi:hypothetical protein
MPNKPVVGEMLRRLRRRSPFSPLIKVHWINSNVWANTKVVKIVVKPCSILKTATVEPNLFTRNIEGAEVELLPKRTVPMKTPVVIAVNTRCHKLCPPPIFITTRETAFLITTHNTAVFKTTRDTAMVVRWRMTC